MRRGLLLTFAVVLLVILGGWLAVRQAIAAGLVRSAIEHQLTIRFGRPVHIAAATASIFPRVGVDLRDVTIGTPPAVTVGHLELHTGLRALLSHQIANADVVIADGRIQWPLPFPLASAPPNDTDTTGVTVTSISRIQFKNITMVSTLPPLTVDLDAALNGDRLDIEQIDARSGKTRLLASGTLDSISRMEGSLRVKGQAEVGGYDVTDVSGSLALAHDTFTLTPLSFAILGGRFQGRLAGDLRPPAPRLQLAGDVSNIDVARAMRNGGAPPDLTGTLHGHLQVDAEGTDGLSLLRTAAGHMTLEIVKGTIPHLDMVRAVVLAFGRPDRAAPAGSGSAFESLGGPFVLANRTMSSDAVALRSRDFDMIASGRLRLDTAAVDGRANVILSQALTAQAGTDLRRYASQNGRVIVPVTISGTLNNPTVFVDLAGAAKRALEDEIKRRLGDWLGGFIKKKGGG